LRRDETALGENRVGELLAWWGRLAACFAGGVYGVLSLNGADDFRNGDAELRQAVRFYPHAHGVLARAEHLAVANARRTEEGIDEIDVRVVAQKRGIVGPVRRVNRKEHEGSRYRLAHGNAVVGDFHREL